MTSTSKTKKTSNAKSNTNVPEADSRTVLFKFGTDFAPVPAARHINPDGSEGGMVARTASVAPTAFVGNDAQVYGTARVFEEATISDNARVFDGARVGKSATVLGFAKVHGDALVTGCAVVRGHATVEGCAWIRGYATVEGSSYVYGNAEVGGRVHLNGATVNSDANLSGTLTLKSGDVATSSPRKRGKTFVVEKGLDIVAEAALRQSIQQAKADFERAYGRPMGSALEEEIRNGTIVLVEGTPMTPELAKALEAVRQNTAERKKLAQERGEVFDPTKLNFDPELVRQMLEQEHLQHPGMKPSYAVPNLVQDSGRRSRVQPVELETSEMNPEEVVGVPISRVHPETQNEKVIIEFQGGPEEARRHRNPNGNLGGWVSLSSEVSSKAYVGYYAKVSGSSFISDSARIEEHAEIGGGSRIRECAVVRGHAIVHSSVINGNALVADWSSVHGSLVTGQAFVGEYAMVYSSEVSGQASVKGTATVCQNSKIGGDTIIKERCSVHSCIFKDKKSYGGRQTLSDMVSDES